GRYLRPTGRLWPNARQHGRHQHGGAADGGGCPTQTPDRRQGLRRRTPAGLVGGAADHGGDPVHRDPHHAYPL
ncbi:MAG: hypothetical protein AVDCRST_MAG91-1274, partial [uncultured Sphingomonadaceae bacterium]